MQASSTLSNVVFLMICQTAFGALNCPVLFHGIKGHSACVPASKKYEPSGVSEQERKVILKKHNDYRAAVNPPSCNMLKLYWDDDFAYVAQRWAQNCEFKHDVQVNRSVPGSLSAGQNLGYATLVPILGRTSWGFIIDRWHREVKDFTYGGTSNDYMRVGHYLQVVWDTTTVIGCGYAVCGKFELYVCNYGPSLNLVRRYTPYEKCAQKTPLKDCKGKFCRNEGSMKKGSCECDCKVWAHIYGPECSTKCSVQDPSDCGTKSRCKFLNIPPKCPNMCGTCPYLDQANNATQKTTIKTTTKAGGSSTTDSGGRPDIRTTTEAGGKSTTDSGGRPGAVPFKYSEMFLLPLMALFAMNWLLQ